MHFHSLHVTRQYVNLRILAAQRIEARYAISDRVCPSVCLSHSWITPKQFKISKYALRRTIEACCQFLEAEFPHPEYWGSPQRVH